MTVAAVEPSTASVFEADRRRVLPLLCAMHVIQFLDLTAVSFAALQMNDALGISPVMFGFGASGFFAAYALCEIPSNMAFARFGARRWLTRIMLTWGLVTMLTPFSTNTSQFVAMRVALGAAQAGFVPATVIFLGRWYSHQGRARAMGLFLAAPAFAGVIAGPLAAGLLGLDGRLELRGFQWLFVVEGALAVALSFVVLKFLPESPRTWREQTSSPPESARIDLADLLTAMARPVVWRLAAVNFSINASLFAMDLWTPQILQTVGGLSTSQIGLAVTIPNIVTAVGMILIGAHADRSKRYRSHIVLPVFTGAIGLGLAAVTDRLGLMILALTLARLAVLSGGPFWALVTTRLGRPQDAGAVACVTTVGVLTGVVWPFVVGAARDLTSSFSPGLAILAVALIVGAMLSLRLPDRGNSASL